MRSRSTSGRAALRAVEADRVPWGANERNVTTPRLGLNKPTVGADIDIWGDYLNANCDVLDQSLLLAGGIMAGPLGGFTAATASSPAFSVSSGTGLFPIGGLLGVAANNSNVFLFGLAGNQSLVPLLMNSNRVQGVAPPIVAGDAVNLGYLQSTQGDYLPLAGSPPNMEGPLNMGGNLLTGLAIPQNPADATSKQYVDALVADLRLFMGTWQVAANVPDISDISAITAGDYYIAVTADPTVPETAPPNIPGIAGQVVHNGDMVIYDENDSIWELVRGGPLTVAEADELFVSKAGDTMSGPLSAPGLSVLGPGVRGISYDGAGAGGSDIAFAAMGNALAFYQNGSLQDYLVGRSGTTMTGPLILAGDATQARGATTLEQVLAIAGNYLPLVGGGLSGGLNFGSEVATAPSDLSRHISLFGGNQYGLGITGNRLNYNSQGGHWFRSAGTDVVQVSATGLSMASGDVFLLRDPSEPLMAASKAYVDAHVSGIPEAPENDVGYVRYNAEWLSGDSRYLAQAGGTVAGDLVVNGGLAVNGWGINAGGSGIAYTGLGWVNRIAFGWNGDAGLIYCGIDGNYLDLLATTGWTQAYAGSNFLGLGGGTISGSLAVTEFINCNALGCAAANAGFFTATESVQGRNLLAFTGAFWDGSYLCVGAGWEYCWQFTVGGDGVLYIQNSQNAGNRITVNQDGTLYGPRLTGGECTMAGNTSYAPYVNVGQNMNAGGEVVGFQLWAGPAGIVSASDYTVKPSGGLWGTLLDERLVNDRGDYEMGLGEVLRLRPIRYTLKDRISIKGHAFGSAEEHVGLVAQEAEAVMPGMVSKIIASLNDTEMDDLRMLDASPLLYALVNALKEVDARLRALEGGQHVQ